MPPRCPTFPLSVRYGEPLGSTGHYHASYLQQVLCSIILVGTDVRHFLLRFSSSPAALPVGAALSPAIAGIYTPPTPHHVAGGTGVDGGRRRQPALTTISRTGTNLLCLPHCLHTTPPCHMRTFQHSYAARADTLACASIAGARADKPHVCYAARLASPEHVHLRHIVVVRLSTALNLLLHHLSMREGFALYSCYASGIARHVTSYMACHVAVTEH